MHHTQGRVVGIGLLPENIKVCQLLAAEHPDYKVKFVNARVEDVIVNLQKNQFDLVLGLSVFHHLCVAYGRQNVVKLLAYNDTHLTEVKRPLLLASKYFVYDDKLGFFKIDSVQKSAHYYQPEENRERKYFICGNIFVKHIVKLFDWEDREISQEVNFLRDMGGKECFPKLFFASVTSYGNDKEFFIAREKLNGVLLSQKMKAGENFDSLSVIKQILKQLVYLESRGYYYNDLRVWNVLYDNDSGTATLIDYGAIGRNKKDILPPYDLRICFFRFMNEVFEKKFSCTQIRKIFDCAEKTYSD